jgi:transposase
MMGERQVDQGALFTSFRSRSMCRPTICCERSTASSIFDVRTHLASFYSTTGRPSVDPELLIRMLIIGYCYGIRSDRRLCAEGHLNLAYRWFCRLGLAGEVPDHSTCSKNRHGRFRESDLLRHVFETVLRRCIEEGLVGGAGFAVDGSLIKADASRQKASRAWGPGVLRLRRQLPRRRRPQDRRGRRGDHRHPPSRGDGGQAHDRADD